MNKESVEPCKLGKILLQVFLENEKQAEILKQAIENNAVWTANKLALQLRKANYIVGPTTIKDHRRHECGCFV